MGAGECLGSQALEALERLALRRGARLFLKGRSAQLLCVYLCSRVQPRSGMRAACMQGRWALAWRTARAIWGWASQAALTFVLSGHIGWGDVRSIARDLK